MRRLCLLILAILLSPPVGAQRAPLSSKPDTPFKLATFEAAGKTRVGLVLGSRVLDIAGANAELTQKAGVPAMRIPAEMRELIEAVPARVAAAVSDRELLQGGEATPRRSRSTSTRSRSRRRSNTRTICSPRRRTIGCTPARCSRAAARRRRRRTRPIPTRPTP